jgi:CMP-N-acetylneuraminic acid synthetase
MNILGVIPARGDSKGIPKKNLALLHDKPLLLYTIEAARESRMLHRVILSTDSEEIKSIGEQAGIEVPFLRPKNLAADATPMIDVLRHLLDALRERNESPDAIVLLQPTSPLRDARDIDQAIDLFLSTRADTVVSVIPVPHNFLPGCLMQVGNDERLTHYMPHEADILRRQDKPLLFARNGPAILITKRDIIEGGSIYGKEMRGFVMHRSHSVDIDDADDLAYAEFLLQRHSP